MKDHTNTKRNRQRFHQKIYSAHLMARPGDRDLCTFIAQNLNISSGTIPTFRLWMNMVKSSELTCQPGYKSGYRDWKRNYPAIGVQCLIHQNLQPRGKVIPNQIMLSRLDKSTIPGSISTTTMRGTRRSC